MKKVLTVFLTAIYLLSVICTAAAMPSLDTADTLDDLGLVETEFASGITQENETEDADVIEEGDALAQELEADDYDVFVQDEEIPGEVVYHKDFESEDSSLVFSPYGRDVEWGGGTGKYGVEKKDVDGDGIDEGVMSMESNAGATYNTRLKFLNAFNQASVTPRDIGSEYVARFRIYNPEEAFDITLSVYSGRTFNSSAGYNEIPINGTATYAAFGNPVYSKTYTIAGNSWTTIDYPLNSDNSGQNFVLRKLFMDELAIEFGRKDEGVPRKIYIDEITVTKTSSAVEEKPEDDLQNIFDDSAVKLDGVVKNGGKYELSNGGSIKYGSEYTHTRSTTSLPSVNTVASRFLAEKGAFYAVKMRAKIPEGKLQIKASSATVDRTFNVQSGGNADYPVIFNNDFTLSQGSSNVIILSGVKSGDAAVGQTMPATGDEFDDIAIIYQDTGIANERKYFGKDQDILRALDIYSTGDGNVIESFNVSKIDDINAYIEDLYFPGNFSNWTEKDGFSVSDNSILVHGSDEENALTYNFKGFQGKTLVLDYDANLNNLPGADEKFPYIGIYDSSDNLLGLSFINSTFPGAKKIVANIPVVTAANEMTTLKIKIVSGSGFATVSDISLNSFADLCEITKTINEKDKKLNVSADFGSIDVVKSFKIAVMKPGKTIFDLSDASNILGSAYSNTAAIDADFDLSSIETFSETLNIIIYNEEKSVYILDTYDYLNAGFVKTLLSQISNASSAGAVKAIVEGYDEKSGMYYKEILGFTDIPYYTNASDDDLEFIYEYIYNCRNEIINPNDGKDLTNIHDMVYKAAFVSAVKASDKKQNFTSVINEFRGVLDFSKYSAVNDLGIYTDKCFEEKILSPVCTMIATGLCTTFEDVMDAICDLIASVPGDDLQKFTLRCNFENGSALENELETGGQANAKVSTAQASDLGIVDHTTGTGNGSVLAFTRDNNSNTGRMKITNVFNPNGLTPRDLGSRFKISFWVYNPNGEAKTVKYGLMSYKGYKTDGKVDYNKTSKYATSFEKSWSATIQPNVWTYVSTEINGTSDSTKTALISSMLAGSLGIEPAEKTFAFYFDDFSIERVEDDRPVIDENDLQPMTNTSAISLSKVTKTTDGYEFASGGTLKYGAGSNSSRKMRYVAEPGAYYQISMVAKTTENGLKLSANSIILDKAGTPDSNTEFVVKEQDDFDLVAGNENGVVISCDGKIAKDGMSMFDTNGEFKAINILFKDTGIKNEIPYNERTLDVLRAINITGNAADNVVKSMTVKKVTSSFDEVGNGTFDSDIAFESWGESSVDTSAFENTDGVLKINGSEDNDGKSLSQVIMLDKNTFYQLGFTAVSASGDAVIQVIDSNGKIIGETRIAPVSNENAEKVVVFKTGNSNSDIVPTAIKIVAGKTGTDVIDNLRILKPADSAYNDLSKYTPLTSIYSSADDEIRAEIIEKTLSVDSNNAEEMLRVMCDTLIDYAIENSNKHNDVVFGIIDDNSGYLNLTNWSKVTAFKGTRDYNTVKANIVKYVLENGYDDLDDKIPSLLPEKDDNKGSSSGGGGGRPSVPSTITSTVPSTDEPNNDVTFSDMYLAQWAEESVISLAKKGVISGYEDGSFRPNNSITRAEFAKLLVLAFDVEDKTAVSTFNDVSPFDWYYSYVATLEKLGVAKGMGNGAYGAYEQISRQDMVVLIVRMAELLDLPINATTSEITFADNNDIAAYALEAVKILQRAEIVSGFEDNIFGPNQTATRAQVAKILNALIG